MIVINVLFLVPRYIYVTPYKDKNDMKQYRKQKGAVMIVAIVFLLVITILGVSAVNSSIMKTQIAGNSIYTMLVYHGAESALSKSVSDTDLRNLRDAIDPTKSVPFPVDSTELPDEEIISGGTLSSSAAITYIGKNEGCPETSGLAASTGVGDAGFDCYFFKIDATSRIISTNAKDQHIKGVAIFSP